MRSICDLPVPSLQGPLELPGVTAGTQRRRGPEGFTREEDPKSRTDPEGRAGEGPARDRAVEGRTDGKWSPRSACAWDFWRGRQ